MKLKRIHRKIIFLSFCFYGLLSTIVALIFRNYWKAIVILAASIIVVITFSIIIYALWQIFVDGEEDQ